jgi:hypothetical protein
LIAAGNVERPNNFSLCVVLDLDASFQAREQGLHINQRLTQHGM